MAMFYISLGAFLGMFLTLVIVRPKRCKECMEREWLAQLQAYLDDHGPKPAK